MKQYLASFLRKIFREKHLGYKVRYEFLGLHINASPFEYLRREIKKIINNSRQFKKIIILFNHTGETSFLLSGLYQNLNRAELNDILFIGTISYHRDLINLYCPTNNYIFRPDINWVHVRWDVSEVAFNVKETIVILSPVTKYFAEYEKAVRMNSNFPHFCRNLFEKNKRFYEPEDIKPFISKRQKIWTSTKLKASNVNKKYILISNESASNKNFPWIFWFTLSHKLRLLGYDVVFNTFINSPASSIGKSFFTTLGEGIEVARHAECLIALRSGFLDLSLPVAKQMIVLYTPFKFRSRELPIMTAAKVQKAFSLKEIPCKHKCNINELIIENPENVDFTKLIDMVINSITPPPLKILRRIILRLIFLLNNFRYLSLSLELS